MSAATIGALKVVLGLDSAMFETGLTAAQKQLRSTGKAMQETGKQIATAGAAMTATITTAFVGLGFHLLKGSQDAAHAAGQVEAALNSMGGASGKALPQLQQAAEALRNLTGIDDDEIMTKVTANLLTFGNVAGDVFDRAQLSVLNISARMKTDLMGSTMMVGKALNAPTQGLAALRRVGIQFTEQQEKQIKAMDAAGNAAGAQAIMLGELERQFGGAAEAAANADIWTPLKTALMDLEGAFEPLVRDVVGPMIQSFADLARSLAALSPQTQKFILVGGAIAAALGPVLIAVGAVVAAVGTLVAALGTGGALAGAGVAIGAIVPFILPVAAAVGLAVAAFLLFRDDVEPVLKRLWATAQQTLGPALGELFSTVRGLVEGLAEAFVTFVDSDAGQAMVRFGAMMAEVMGTALIRVLTAAVQVVSGALKSIGLLFSVLGDLLTGDFSGAWNSMRALVSNAVETVGKVIDAVFPGALGWMRKLYEGVKSWLQDKLGGVFTFVSRKVKEAGDAFFNLYDRVVGNSYVPDMVTEVGQWMSRLQQVLVDPATRATKTAADRFKQMRDDVRGVMQGLMTDIERAEVEYQDAMAKITAARADPNADQALLDEFARRARERRNEANVEVLTSAPQINLRPLDEDGRIQRFQDSMREVQERIKDSREDFAEAFARGIRDAMDGDWKGLLRSIVGDIFDDSLRQVGRMLFNFLQKSMGDGQGGWDFAKIGSSIASIFGGGAPKFATGGRLLPGGAGGVDSQFVQFWKSPGEQVDIYTPGQDMGPRGGGITNNYFNGNLLTPEFWERIHAGDQAAEERAHARAIMDAPRVAASQGARQQQYQVGRQKR